MDVSEKESVYEFSGYRLDAAHRKLLSPAGTPVPLTSRVFDTLLYLVQHQGELVDKAALMQAVENQWNQWGQTPLISPQRWFQSACDLLRSIKMRAAGGRTTRPAAHLA